MMKHIYEKMLCLIALLLSVTLTAAVGNAREQNRQQNTVRYSSGTGFFVSRQGQIITNAHVISPCGDHQRVTFANHRTGKTPREARVVAVDEKRDLALLATGYRPERIAYLRFGHDEVKPEEEVMLIGYPNARSVDSPYVVATSTIKALEGPFGEDTWLQFNDAARHGNSGGPLLDLAGNVVGVVTAKSKVMRMNRFSSQRELIAESDLAVTSEELRRFLDEYSVHYNQEESGYLLSPRRIETMAQSYVVHIFCSTESN
ncbi:MAG: serine protease [Alphaproteobacteria bacterium]|nr:MAG: serine protease [Alphaproteobacteria bacterium]